MKHLTSPPDLSVLPPEYVNIVGKALAKNPAHRYVSVMEMAKEVEAVGRGPEAKRTANSTSGSPRFADRGFGAPASPQTPPAAVPVLTALPVISPRQQLAELCGSMALAPVVGAFFSTLWMSVSSITAKGSMPGNGAVTTVDTEIGFCFFLTVAICWAVLVPAKLWSGRKGDSGMRRGVMTIMGVLVGLVALWIGGRILSPVPGEASVAEVNLDPTKATLFQNNEDIFMAARYLTYFGLVFFAVRWWKMADRHRSQRFSFAPILVVGFWALVLLLVGLGPQPQGAVALVLAAAIVQLVSPWQPLPPPVMKRMRLRYT